MHREQGRNLRKDKGNAGIAITQELMRMLVSLDRRGEEPQKESRHLSTSLMTLPSWTTSSWEEGVSGV
jgi:hypothetical protein